MPESTYCMLRNTSALAGTADKSDKNRKADLYAMLIQDHLLGPRYYPNAAYDCSKL